MKKLTITLILLALFATGITLQAQNTQNESLGLPGDNLNLYAVMKLFQESETLEGFEKRLNEENSNINNLDLNGDNLVDYIRVIDNIDNDVHTIVLQVALDHKENQDVAVFTVQRFQNGQVYIQLIGDDELYGKDYIIEPNYNDSDETPNPGYTGNNNTFNGQNITYVRTTPVEIAAWPLVRFIFLPNYVRWHSTWYYGYYPSYWHPWQPYYWDHYYGYHYNWYYNYYGHFRRSNYHRYTRWNDFYYTSRRSYSPVVIVKIKEGNYKSTYSRPDQRRVGEDKFAKQHPEQTIRRSEENVRVSRPSAQPAPDRRATDISTQERRSTDTPARTGTDKGVSNSGVNNSDASTRRAPASVNTKSETRPAANQNSGTTRRTQSTVTRTESKAVVREQKAATPRPSRESSSTKVSTPARRTTEKAAKETTVRQSEKKKEETTTPSRRK